MNPITWGRAENGSIQEHGRTGTRDTGMGEEGYWNTIVPKSESKRKHGCISRGTKNLEARDHDNRGNSKVLKHRNKRTREKGSIGTRKYWNAEDTVTGEYWNMGGGINGNRKVSEYGRRKNR